MRGDADAVTAKLEELTKSKDDVALAEWTAKRREELTERNKVRFWIALNLCGIIAEHETQQATALKAFIDHLESMDSFKKNDLKSERRTE